jgi:acyl dehydratase
MRIDDDLLQWIGREISYTAPDEIGRPAIRFYALALGDDNPLYFDEAFAACTRFGGIIAPPTLVCETNQYMVAAPGPDGYTGHVWSLPIPPSRMTRIGNAYEFFQPLRPTDRITATWRLVDIEARSTRLGDMLFVDSDVRYTNQLGELLAINRETMAFAPIDEG